MNKIIEYRAQEQICRQRAVFDLQHKHYWLGLAEMWWHKAQDEISAAFEARGGSVKAGSMTTAVVPAMRRADSTAHV